jgi:hypothetical protein
MIVINDDDLSTHCVHERPACQVVTFAVHVRPMMNACDVLQSDDAFVAFVVSHVRSRAEARMLLTTSQLLSRLVVVVNTHRQQLLVESHLLRSASDAIATTRAALSSSSSSSSSSPLSSSSSSSSMTSLLSPLVAEAIATHAHGTEATNRALAGCVARLHAAIAHLRRYLSVGFAVAEELSYDERPVDTVNVQSDSQSPAVRRRAVMSVEVELLRRAELLLAACDANAHVVDDTVSLVTSTTRAIASTSATSMAMKTHLDADPHDSLASRVNSDANCDANGAVAADANGAVAADADNHATTGDADAITGAPAVVSSLSSDSSVDEMMRRIFGIRRPRTPLVNTGVRVTSKRKRGGDASDCNGDGNDDDGEDTRSGESQRSLSPTFPPNQPLKELARHVSEPASLRQQTPLSSSLSQSLSQPVSTTAVASSSQEQQRTFTGKMTDSDDGDASGARRPSSSSRTTSRAATPTVGLGVADMNDIVCMPPLASIELAGAALRAHSSLIGAQRTHSSALYSLSVDDEAHDENGVNVSNG